jgi:hypothetical protein
MQNRVKRLLFEEERARKLESMAKNKADKMLEARDRHQKVIYTSSDHIYIGSVREVSLLWQQDSGHEQLENEEFLIERGEQGAD